ncbi:MAG: phosphatase PAP2 family protein [Acidimicrobiales bacterium]|nr:phosphatase PAP2 family protein [Acidimicrobiales bacterium]
MTVDPAPRPQLTPVADPGSPWPPVRVGVDPLEGAGGGGFNVFVPAIMSVGLVFSVVTLIRDVFQWSGSRARERRTAIEANTVLNDLLGIEKPDARDIGLLARPAYLLSALAFVGGAAYVAIGSTANFLRDEGYVRDIGWLLALSLALAALLGFIGTVSIVVFRSWPAPPPWAYGSIRTAPLTVTPGRTDVGPSWILSAAVLGAMVVSLILSLMAGTAESIALGFDEPISMWLAEIDWLDQLRFVDPYGATWLSILFVIGIAFAGYKCRVMAVLYPAAFVLGWVSVEVIQDLVLRPRPTGLGDPESFPSGHMVQAVFIAGLVPLALRVFFEDRRVALVAQVALAAGVIATALHRLHRGDHWPLDGLAGVSFGLVIVLTAHWAMAHRRWHQHCHSCPWAADHHHEHHRWTHGVIHLPHSAKEWLSAAGPILAVMAAAALAWATLTIGIPNDPEDTGLGAAIAGPLQLGLGAMMLVAAAVALRWRAMALFMMAVAAFGLGLLSAIEYTPTAALLLTSVLVVPAIVTWLGWQGHATTGSIAALAILTASGLVATGFGSVEVHEHFFGPTHPDSAMPALRSDAGWLWLGGVTSNGAAITAGGLPEGSSATLRYWPTTAIDAAFELTVGVDPYGLASFELDDLQAGTDYSYRVDSANDPATTEERREASAQFRTFAAGAQDVTVVLGACARRESNGSVFDAMVGENPDLFLALGDLHYADLESTDPARHIREYGRSLGQPGQSALFRSVPTAYVWDDHDFGPNDSDSTSPSVEAVGEAYRRSVPNYGVDPDVNAPIAQAFTVGRVRFVFSDTRSQRTETTMLGETQLDWLIDELVTSSRDHALIVWANPTPWIGNAGSGADTWSQFPAERTRIADALAAAEVDNLVMVSGDAHMVAIDDGTNSGYATDGTGGFPVLHAAALDRPGSKKGGPYSHGTFPGGGQYAKLEIEDDGGSRIDVTMSGHTWDGEELVALDLSFEVAPGRA